MPAEPASLVEYLERLGATEDEMARAKAAGRLPSLAVDLTLRSTQVLTPRAVATRLGMSIDQLVDVARALGLAPTDPDEPSFSEADLAVLVAAPVLGTDLLRVAGGSLSRLAEAAVAAYVQTREVELVEAGAGALAWAQASADIGRLALEVGNGLGSIFVHHVQEAIRWQRESQAPTHDRELARLAVGFVDLTGFTALSRHLPPAELIKVITQFESTAYDVAAELGGRIVKHIGDEIMFVALDAASGARIARALLAALPADTFRPRGGLSYGDLLVRHGDYYGPVVNLASRLVDEAIPGEVLVDSGAGEAAWADDPDLVFEPAGRRLLRGFDEPVTTFSLS